MLFTLIDFAEPISFVNAVRAAPVPLVVVIVTVGKSDMYSPPSEMNILCIEPLSDALKVSSSKNNLSFAVPYVSFVSTTVSVSNEKPALEPVPYVPSNMISMFAS